MNEQNANVESEATEAEESTEKKVKTVKDNMTARRIFSTVEDATAYIETCQRDLVDFASTPVVTVGFTDEGDFDPAIYNESMDIGIVKLTERGEGAGSSTVKMIVIYPSPKVHAILGLPLDFEIDPEAKPGFDWLEGVIQKELNHVAVRNLRKAEGPEEIREVLEKVPTSIADYITSQRESSSGILETYNQTWQLIKKMMGKRSKQFAIANLSKKELKKSMESASYAAMMYPVLEARKNKAGEDESYFQIAATFGVKIAKKEGLDPAIFEKMLETRNEVQIGLVEDEEEFDYDQMLEELEEDEDDDS